MIPPIQSNESKWKDALIFLLDCSSLMQFPADEAAMREMAEEGRIRVKHEGSTVETASGHHASAHDFSNDGPSSAAAAGGAAAAPAARDPSLPDHTQFQMVLSVVLHSLRQKIICTPDDYVAIVLFGSRATKNENGFPHIYVHTPLQNLTAAAIRRVDALMDSHEFESTIGSLTDAEVASGRVEMDKILWICSSLFTEAQVSNCHKRILLLTNNDTPFNAHDPMSRLRAVQKGKDLRDLDIGIDLIAVGPKPSLVGGRPKSFNPLLFFKDILICDEDESLDAMAETFRTKFSDLRDRLFKKQMKKRSLGSVPLQLGVGVNIGVRLYCMLRETRRETAVLLDKETNERLSTQTRYLDTNTGAVLRDFEMQKYYPYGGAKVIFKDAELKQIKEIDSTGLVLMGFKPFDAIKVHFNFKNSYFIYPDDAQFTDSAKAFKALLIAMSELKQVAICRLIYRRGSIPRFVALLPQMAKIDPDDGEVLQAPGMNLIFLPYADDIRSLRFDPTPIATPQLIDDAKKVVAKLTVKSLPRISNPVLQKHYRVIQAIALEEEPPQEDEFEDALLPDTEGMAKYAPLIQKWASDARALGEAAQAEAEPPAARKRKAAADGEDGPKRPKKEEPDYADVDWKQHLANGQETRCVCIMVHAHEILFHAHSSSPCFVHPASSQTRSRS